MKGRRADDDEDRDHKQANRRRAQRRRPRRLSRWARTMRQGRWKQRRDKPGPANPLRDDEDEA